ncbi:hypothetical protein [Vagococcus xieshaowenii]|uniref:WxL domain-containing protein n=1 Tax=Vagococcus xieshaowenii TaxID=2562451 RepID=A0A4Z0D9K2_9ENTE|nr:hypothetical protein [Vagococcus xieshaowenii]QCA29434.1 hypothetical protein E4Z98_08935 [Vagococcus xieshaowenii]TFZ41554.1 hypothetical protein E4031_05010 [Vagococcus xieshaowenii]
MKTRNKLIVNTTLLLTSLIMGSINVNAAAVNTQILPAIEDYPYILGPDKDPEGFVRPVGIQKNLTDLMNVYAAHPEGMKWTEYSSLQKGSVADNFTTRGPGFIDVTKSHHPGFLQVYEKSRVSSIQGNDKLNMREPFRLVTYIKHHYNQNNKETVDGGMGFVMHSGNDSGTGGRVRLLDTWIGGIFDGATLDGSQKVGLGILGDVGRYTFAKDSKGIPHSFAVEFDLYGDKNGKNFVSGVGLGLGEGSYFDVDPNVTGGPNNNHVGYYFPENLDEGVTYGKYTDRWGLAWRKVIHNAPQKVKLTDGTYKRFEVSWEPGEGDNWADGRLEYQYDGQRVLVDQALFKKEVLEGGTVDQVYWGFNGTEGNSESESSKRQRVYFEQVPGYLDSTDFDVSTNFYQEDGTPVEVDTLTGGMKYRGEVVVKRKKNGNTTPWENINIQVTVPSVLDIATDETLMVNDTKTSVTADQGNNRFDTRGKYNVASADEYKVSFNFTPEDTVSRDQMIDYDIMSDQVVLREKGKLNVRKNEVLSARIDAPKDGDKVVVNRLETGKMNIDTRSFVKYFSTAQLAISLEVRQGEKDATTGLMPLKTTINEAVSTPPINAQGMIDQQALTNLFTLDIKQLMADKQLNYGDFQIVYRIKNNNASENVPAEEVQDNTEKFAISNLTLQSAPVINKEKTKFNLTHFTESPEGGGAENTKQGLPVLSVAGEDADNFKTGYEIKVESDDYHYSRPSGDISPVPSISDQKITVFKTDADVVANPNLPEAIAGSGSVSGATYIPGNRKVKVTIIDADKNESDPVELPITFESPVIVDIPDKFDDMTLDIGSKASKLTFSRTPEQEVRQVTEGQQLSQESLNQMKQAKEAVGSEAIVVYDGSTDGWELSATSEFKEDKADNPYIIPDGFLYYQQGDKKTVIRNKKSDDDKGVTLLSKKLGDEPSFTNKEISQSGTDGFYIDSTKNVLAATYNGVINWTLSNTPSP